MAIDHGLTEGEGSGVPPLHFLQDISNFANTLDAVVVNRGILPMIQNIPINIFLQCFGAPSGYRREQISDIESALRADAVGISVQISLRSTSLSEDIRSVSELVQIAERYDMQTMFMMSGFDACEVQEFLRAVRIATELGATIVKVPLPNQPFNNDDLALVSSVIALSPPVLFAGGTVSSPELAQSQRQMARDLGCRGFCVGRQVFTSTNPAKVISDLTASFARC